MDSGPLGGRVISSLSLQPGGNLGLESAMDTDGVWGS